ncbi:MAG: hypothetical protein LLG00_11765 [Planctomycetaceae bacterium]|nr:hypothetical protein [Planctomycetaceae bacterium]
MNRMLALLGVAAIVALCGLSPAGAAVLAPGTGPVAPDVFGTGPTGDVLAVSGTPFATPGGDTGTLLTAVVRDTPNGTLDFLYQWTAAAGNQDNFIATSAISFDSFDTDVGYLSAGASLSAALVSAGFTTPNGGIPTDVQRSLSGNTVDWFFPGTAFLPGATGAILMVKTSAFFFEAGVAGIQDGTTANVPAFSPAVPEPISLLVWLGIGGVGLVARSWAGRKR